MVAEPVEEKQEETASPAPGKVHRRLILFRRRPREEGAVPEEEPDLPQPSMTGWIIAAAVILLVSGAYALGFIPDLKTLLYGLPDEVSTEEPLVPDTTGSSSEETQLPEEIAPAGEGAGASGAVGAEGADGGGGADQEAIRTVAELYNAMPPVKAAPLLASMDPGQAVAVLREMRREQAAAVLAQMESDEAAVLIRLLMNDQQEGGGQR